MASYDQFQAEAAAAAAAAAAARGGIGEDDYSQYDVQRDDQDAIFAALLKLIEEDKSEEFIKTIRALLDTPSLKKRDLECFASELLFSICESKAFLCAGALLKGHTGLTVDLNMPFAHGYGYPLHYVACKLCPTLTKLFLDCGAKGNLRDRDGSLPLDLALQQIRKMVWWTCEQSVYRLLFSLCGSRIFKPMYTLKYLASSLSVREWCDIMSRYLLGGKIIELAALLIMIPGHFPFVCSLHLPSDGDSLAKRMTIRQYVVNEILLLTNEECKFESIGSSRLADCRHKKKLFTSIMLLLEIFHRMNYHFESNTLYTHNTIKRIGYVADMLVRLEFKLTGEDALLFTQGLRFAVKDFHPPLYIKVGSGKVECAFKMKNLPFEWGPASAVAAELRTYIDSFQTDDIDYVGAVDHKLQALHSGIENIRSNVTVRKCTSKKLILKLISMLCLPNMTAALEAIKVQVQNTEKVHDIACYYAKEDKLIELAILLMAARKKIIDQIPVDIEKSSTKTITFRQLINGELAQLIDLDYRLIGRGTVEEKMLSRLCKRRMSSLVRALPLIEIFEKAGLGIEEYLASRKTNVSHEQVAKDATKLFEDTGFKLKSRYTEIDNEVDRGSIKMRLEDVCNAIEENKESTEMYTGSQQQDVVLAPYLQLRGFPIMHAKSPYGMPGHIHRFISARYPQESDILLSPFQPYRAFWISGIHLYSGYQKALEPDDKRVMAAEQQRKKFQKAPESSQNEVIVAVGKLRQKLQGRKRISPLTSLLRLGIRCL